jgi:phosphopantothenoylcysteine decarboxylase/phosphopantothenate--cysteine ligase
LADECAARGAKVVMIAGPCGCTPHYPMHQYIKVESAEEMFDAAYKLFATVDAAILSAAVADFTPASVAAEKIKRRKGEEMQLRLAPTKDIAAFLGSIKKKNQILAGFALETSNEQHNAEEKLKWKNLDFIVLNSLRDEGAGFRTDTNKVTIIDAKGKTDYPLKSKREVAADIIDHLVRKLKEKK